MGAIRGIFLVLVSVLLLLSLSAVVTFGILSASTDYNNIQNQSVFVKEFLQKDTNLTSIISSNYPYIQAYCQNQSVYVFSTGGYVLNVSCNNVLKGQNEFLEDGVRSMIYRIYYTDYNCNFLDCFKSNEIPLFLISEKTHNFFEGKFWFFLVISFALFIFLFLLIQKKANSFLFLGVFFIIPSIFLFKMDVFFNAFPNKAILQFLNLFFSQSFSIALQTLIIGIVFVIAGIVWKIFDIGFFISNFISKIKNKREEAEKQKLILNKKLVKKTPKPKYK